MRVENFDTEVPLTYSVVVPVYNGENTLEELAARIEKVLGQLGESYELIFIDDNSTDRSWDILRSLRDSQPSVRCLQLMRNYGQQNATMCGFHQARGRYLITLDDDLQNPPEEIPALISEIRKGFDVVFGIYESKKHGYFRNLCSRVLNTFYAWTFKTKGRVSAFRIMRAEVAAKILEYDLNFTYINGLVAWYTDRISHVYVEHEGRPRGRSGYTLKKLMTLSINMMTNFSILPLQIASLAGLVFALMGFGMGAYFIVRKLWFGASVSGFTALIAPISFFSGIILFFQGIIGEYLGRIHFNINRKPQFSIRKEEHDAENREL